MSVLTRSALEASPLADLHTIALELGVDGFRRLRKAELIDAIVAHQSDDDDALAEAAEDLDKVQEPPAEEPARPRRRRGGRGRARDEDDGAELAEAEASEDLDKVEAVADDEPARGRARGRGRGDRERERDRDRDRDRDDERVVEGVVDLLGNGSGFVRLTPPEHSDDDVYISAAQVRRCELVAGDHVSGPVRRPRRSERYPSLVRVDTINGAPADEVAEGTPFDELACAWPSERIALGGDDPTIKAIEWLTPLGRGSRATITGGARAGKSEALRRIAGALAGQDGLELSVVLTGVRPEEIPDWAHAGPEPAVALHMAASADAQAQAIERALDTAKRVAARGGHAVVLIDSIDALPPAAARRALAAARAIVEGGTLTVIAVSSLPVGGETTVVALDPALAGAGRFPALDVAAGGTLRPERLVGEDGAKAIAAARAEALGQRGT
jgi:transcription termination factor Rho